MKGEMTSGDRITMAAPANVTVGVPILFGTMFGIPESTQASGEQVSMRIKGMQKVPKVAAQAWATVGAKVYWDDTAKNVTTTASGNSLIGCVGKPALSADTVGYVVLNGITI